VLTRPLTELGSGHAPRLWATREQAEDTAAAWRALPLAAHADDWSFTTAVADPPPLQITREGRTWYLAHFNAYRAVYSPRRPPAEPPAGLALPAGDVPPPPCPQPGQTRPLCRLRPGAGLPRRAVTGRVRCLSVCLRGHAAPYAAGLPRFTIWSDAAGACRHSER
jgi:hypothetical protein